jgi:hypothetical protein
MFACLWMMYGIILVSMFMEGYNVLCFSCFVLVWVERLMCLLFMSIKFNKSTKEETRGGNQYCLMFLYDDVLPCWQLQIWWKLFQDICSVELWIDITQILHGYK